MNSTLTRLYRGFRMAASWTVRRLSMPVIRYAFWAIRRMNMKPEMARIAVESGMDLVPRHYYSPVPDPADFGPGFWDEHSAMPGIAIDDAAWSGILDDVVPKWMPGFRNRYPLERQHAEDTGFYLLNRVYMAVDAHVYYALIRETKPARIVEIGSGMSALLAADAVAENARDGHPCSLTSIEPHPAGYLRAIPGIELVEAKVQDVPLDVFTSLEANDMLFIDSTHVLREGNDVQYEYLEILPRLADGVYVHVHDISLPERYPRAYFEEGWYWNEQYLLQAFLAFNERFEVLWPGNHVMVNHAERLRTAFPEIDEMRKVYPDSEPTAFWMRTRLSR